MMDEATRTQLRAELEEQAARLEDEIAALAADDRENQAEATGENAYRDHMGDQGSATFARELDMTMEENEREELDEVRAALKRLDEGTYGICTRCGCDIPIQRLQAVPAAILCIQCKEVEETR